MQIRFYANLRTVTGHDVLDISNPSVRSLGQLIDYLITIYPEITPLLLDEHGNLPGDIPIFVNGRNPRLDSSGLDLALEPEDVISIFSPIASGRMNVEVMRAATLIENEKTP